MFVISKFSSLMGKRYHLSKGSAFDLILSNWIYKSEAGPCSDQKGSQPSDVQYGTAMMDG